MAKNNKETIDTAIILRAYEEAKGCPHCHYEQGADAYEIDRLLDGGMMVWDIRQETDSRGFCFDHYQKLLVSGNRFSVAVMMESHLREIQNVYLAKASYKSGVFDKTGAGGVITNLQNDCYLCHRMESVMSNFEEGVVHLWNKREEFRTLMQQNGKLCMRHYGRLLSTCERELSAGSGKAMAFFLFDLMRKQLDSLADEAKFYCGRFDYRATGAEKEFGNSADVLERVTDFLTGKHPKG